MAVERRDVLVPADGGQVVLGRVGEVDGAEGAALGRRADAAARHDVRVAEEVVAVRRESRRVLGEAGRQVVAGVQRVDVVGARARGVGAVADEYLLSW